MCTYLIFVNFGVIRYRTIEASKKYAKKCVNL